MKFQLYYFLFITFLSTVGVFAQQLHHQMLSCQGGASSSVSTIKVLYTVGQQSVIGTASSDYIFQQGFQQMNWDTKISKNTNHIQLTAYPNPFTDKLYIKFSSVPNPVVDVLVYDLLGRLVYSDSLFVDNSSIVLDLIDLSSAEYLVHLSAVNYSHSIKIIKK